MELDLFSDSLWVKCSQVGTSNVAQEYLEQT